MGSVPQIETDPGMVAYQSAASRVRVLPGTEDTAPALEFAGVHGGPGFTLQAASPGAAGGPPLLLFGSPLGQLEVVLGLGGEVTVYWRPSREYAAGAVTAPDPLLPPS